MIMVDENYERSSSSVEDEAMPTISHNPSLISPLPSTDKTLHSPRGESTALPSPSRHSSYKPLDSIKPKTESSSPSQTKFPPLMVSIELSRLDFDHPEISPLRRRIQRTHPWLLADRKERASTSKYEPASDCELDSRTKGSDCEKKPVVKNEKEHKQKSKKRKRRNSASSTVSSHSTISSMSHTSSSVKEHHSKDPSKDNPKSKRRKHESKQQQQRSQAENLSLTNAPPTNHEREGGVKNNCNNASGSCASSSSSMQAVLQSPERHYTKSLPQREYHSYFETRDEPSEYEERY